MAIHSVMRPMLDGVNLAMDPNLSTQLLELTNRLLQAIGSRDWDTYAKLCDDSLTCFEPEARGHLVSGLGFHKYYFGLSGGGGQRNTTLSDVHVRQLGQDAAIVSYVRLVQFLDASGQPQTSQYEETRVWQRMGGEWKHVHFHRSNNA